MERGNGHTIHHLVHLLYHSLMQPSPVGLFIVLLTTLIDFFLTHQIALQPGTERILPIGTQPSLVSNHKIASVFSD